MRKCSEKKLSRYGKLLIQMTKAFVFDILYKDGASLLEKPLVERMKILEETIQPDDILMLTSNHIVRDAKTLSLLFEEAISKGLEGERKSNHPPQGSLL
jgi:ATP-dependent DNA ligase